jgi:hypothetical protein
MVHKPEPDLSHVVLAGHASCCLASSLDRRQQQTDQNTDDGNHYQQFDQCKSATLRGSREKSVSQRMRTIHKSNLLEIRTPNRTMISSQFQRADVVRSCIGERDPKKDRARVFIEA